MDCSKVVEKLSFYIDGEIDEHTLEVVEAHLERCPACRQEHAALAALAQAASSVEAVEPPAGLRERIVQAVANSGREARQCARTSELLSAWVDGELSDKQGALVSAHLGECEDCAAEAESLRVLASVAESIEPIEPPASLRARIAAAIVSEPSHRGILAWLREAVTIGSFRWAGGAAAAGLTALVAISMFGGQQGPVYKAAARDTSRPAPAVAVAPDPERQSAAVAAPTRGSQPTGVRSTSVSRRLPRQPRGMTPTMAVAPPAIRMPIPPPAAKHAVPRPVDIEPATRVEAVVAEVTPEPEEVAVAPEPRPAPAPEPTRSDRLAVVRVATTAFTEDAKEWVKEIKTEAVMRKGESRGGIQLVTSRF